MVISNEAVLQGSENKAFKDTVHSIAALDSWNLWHDDPKAARDLLAQLYRALSGAAQPLRINRVDGYDELELDAKVQQIGRGLDEPNGSFWPDFILAPVEDIFDAAFLALRMLDEALSQQATAVSQVTLTEFETDAGYFVVPCRKIDRARSRMKGQGLSRRGLLYHRIAPMNYDGVRLVLHVHPDVALARDSLPPRRKVGAAIFPGVQLEKKSSKVHGPHNFVVSRLNCLTSQEKTVVEQCQSAIGEQCDTLIWPELTMPPERVEQVISLLREVPLQGVRPPVVVAGSWHVPCDGGIRNRSEVLDGRGERMFSFDKCLSYFERGAPEGGAEDIEHGETVQLLLAEDELIVFQICLDFCHVSREALLGACDASLVIVPSMGENSTIRDHIARAKVLQITNNTRTVVVQQSVNSTEAHEGATMGYILQGVAKPGELAEIDTLTSLSFSSFYTEGEAL